MKISIKTALTPRTLSGFVKAIAKLQLNLVEVSSPNALPYQMLIHGIPYEASETYRAIRSEFERNKSLASIETRQILYRC